MAEEITKGLDKSTSSNKIKRPEDIDIVPDTSRSTDVVESPVNERSIANGLKMAQTQAIAVAGFVAESRQCRVCESCLSHRASFHGRGDDDAAGIGILYRSWRIGNL